MLLNYIRKALYIIDCSNVGRRFSWANTCSLTTTDSTSKCNNRNMANSKSVK
jgi:hypothetical protein